MATEPDLTRRGIGRVLIGLVLQAARDSGMEWPDCLSTRTAVPFFAALGFRPLHPVDVPLAPGIRFPAVRMPANLNSTSA